MSLMRQCFPCCIIEKYLNVSSVTYLSLSSLFSGVLDSWWLNIPPYVIAVCWIVPLLLLSPHIMLWELSHWIIALIHMENSMQIFSIF